MTRIIMMGTGPFAVPTFESLLDSEYEVVVLVTQPPPPGRTRGKVVRNPMRDVAEARGIEVLSPDNINSDAAQKQFAALTSVVGQRAQQRYEALRATYKAPPAPRR